jgi:hypothetical protein
MPPDRLRRPRKRAERDRLVLRIEQAIKLGTARFHAHGELGLGNLLAPHQLVELSRQHALDRPRGHAFIDAVPFQEIVEGRSDPARLLFPFVFSFSLLAFFM